MKKFFFIILILFFGALGGFFGDEIIFSRFAASSFLSQTKFFEKLKSARTIIVNREEQVTVRPDERIAEIIEKESGKIVSISSGNFKASGFYVTSDGLVATIDSPFLVANKIYVRIGEEAEEASLFKRDQKNKVALLKIQKSNLPIVSFADNEIKLGSIIFLMARDLSSLFVSEGIIKNQDLEVSFKESSGWAQGAPIFNLKGEVIGLASFDRNSTIKIISADKIENLF
ncbi:MAG: trypsin-like peptidase domain-containing protein [Parcubacteria group bacterium]|nr:trypsin-like peptidase domain-containing protein [Parcubacteria group bacterium]